MHRHNLFHEHAAKRGSDDDLPSISKALDPMNPLGVLSPSNSPNPDDGNSNEKPTPVATRYGTASKERLSSEDECLSLQHNLVNHLLKLL